MYSFALRRWRDHGQHLSRTAECCYLGAVGYGGFRLRVQQVHAGRMHQAPVVRQRKVTAAGLCSRRGAQSSEQDDGRQRACAPAAQSNSHTRRFSQSQCRCGRPGIALVAVQKLSKPVKYHHRTTTGALPTDRDVTVLLVRF